MSRDAERGWHRRHAETMFTALAWCSVSATRILVAAAISLLAAVAVAGPASATPAAYPPIRHPPPRARCSISTIVDRRVAIACNAGRARARKHCAIRIGRTIVARGIVGRDGRYFARFRLRTRLTRGTRISFLVEGKVVATFRS